MRIETKDIMNGLKDDRTVWICSYNQPDLDKKPLRSTPPTRCLICPNSELPDNKRVYYSESHFRPVGKDGSPLKKYLSPVDNTGYRSACGNMINVFDNETECVKEWNNQLDEVNARVVKRIESSQAFWEKISSDIVKKKI